MNKNDSRTAVTVDSEPKGRKINTRTLVTLALLAAISVVLARFIIPMPSPTMRFSIEAVPIILAGFLFGPLPAGLVGFIADLVGCLFSGYGYNPMFSVPPVMIGVCAGLMRPLLYKKITYLRVLAAFAPAVVLGSILWQSYWLSFFYGTKTFGAFLISRSIQFVITSGVNALLVFLLMKSGMFRSLHLWPPKGVSIQQ